MAALIATEQAVRDAVQKILQHPTLKLTNDAVIEMLGGGSKDTVGPLVKKFREEFGKRGGALEPVPTHLAAEAESLVKRLHSVAKEEARREYEGDIMRMSRILTGLQSDYDGAAAQVATAEGHTAKLQDDLDVAGHTIGHLDDQLRMLKEANSLLEASARNAQQELDRANDLIASMKARAEESSRLEERLSRIEAAMPRSGKLGARSSPETPLEVLPARSSV